jgi:hypothetical protein
MNSDATDQTEENLFVSDVSDSVVEAAAQGANGLACSVTLAFCSGLDTCPA